MNRTPTPSEIMCNNLFKHFGTTSVLIRPARRAILGILQTVRPTTARDDIDAYNHFRNRYPTRKYNP